MVQITTLYECEICKTQYGSQEAAEKCEARGQAQSMPIGLLHGHPADPRSFYTAIMFVIAKTHETIGHFAETSMWACRDNGRGDSLGSELCGPGPERLANVSAPSAADLAHPATLRMLKWLRTKNITPLVHAGDGRVIPLAQYCKEQGWPPPRLGR